ncbi:MAG: NAD(P)H-dependent oxidoreductase [bacterium]|nr:NAD(P)H-dependent oxidoreductase [bacterium]
MKKVISIFGSSRENGNTMEAFQSVLGERNAEIINLINTNLSPFDYDHNNKEDSFLAIAEKMVSADTIIIATPVYWYSMSAYCKVFFDRLSDLITIRKGIGRSLKAKKVFVVCTGTGKQLPEGFEVPFASTSKYFDMDYCGIFYYHVIKDQPMSEEQKDAARAFGDKIFK